MARALALGAFFGAVMAGVWAAIALWTGYELGFVACFVGGAIGCGMLHGLRGRGSVRAGVCAAGLAMATVLVGRFIVVQIVVSDFVEEQTAVTDDACVLMLADSIHQDYVDREYDLTWSEDDPYPVEVMAAARARWARMDAEERAPIRAELESQAQAARAFTPVFTILAFVFSFGIMGFVWLGVAMTTAFKIASRHVEVDETGAAFESASTRPGRIEILESGAPTRGEVGIFASLGRVEAARQAKGDESRAA